MDDLQAADDAYESAEAAFIAAIRVASDFATLRALAYEVAKASKTFNDVAYATFHMNSDDRPDLDQLTERTEVLSELWSDLADAFVAGSAESH